MGFITLFKNRESSLPEDSVKRDLRQRASSWWRGSSPSLGTGPDRPSALLVHTKPSDGDPQITPVFIEQIGTQRGAEASKGLPRGGSLPGLDVECTLEQQVVLM